MRLFILSDLHVRDPKSAVFQGLLAWLACEPRAGDQVVFAGDVFDLFIGNKKIFLSRYADFFETLRATADRSVRLHYIEGNHDFFLERVYSGIPGLQVYQKEIDLEIARKRFYIAHGDLADQSNHRYPLLRSFLRSSFLKSFVTLAPGQFVDWIGTTWSNRGLYRREHPYEGLNDVQIDVLRKPFRRFAADKLAEGYDFVILGHTHDSDEARIESDRRAGQYINVGYPPASRTLLVWNEGEASIRRGQFF